MWQSTRLIEIDIGVLKYGRMQLNDLPRFDGVILCYDSLVPTSYEALPNLMGGSHRLTSSIAIAGIAGIPRSVTVTLVPCFFLILCSLFFLFLKSGSIGLPRHSLSSAAVPTYPTKYLRKPWRTTARNLRPD